LTGARQVFSLALLLAVLAGLLLSSPDLAISQVNPDRKAGIHDGNSIRTRFTNFGSIGRYPPRIEWPAYSGHEYGYELGPIIAAEFIRDSETIHCTIEGILDGGDDDLEPYPGYFASLPNESPAMSDDPSTWPLEWTEWPGQFGPGVITADQESYFVMSDQPSNAGPGGGNSDPMYDYYPETDTLQGLAIEISSRGYQWAAAIAEDMIFFVYKIKNIGYKTLDKVVAGYFVDLDVGGYPDFHDDGVDFDWANNLVYSWDTDNHSPNWTGDVGWVGFKYLESPYNDDDGIDNDGDGMVDESQSDGLDNDGDWDLTDEEAQQDPNDWDQLSDDVGADGIPETNDEGEGDSWPTLGEPDFEIRDLDENDQLGLTSMMSYDYNSPYYAGNDPAVWIALTPGSFSQTFPIGDNVFFFGSGYFSLEPGQSQPMSIAIVVGADSIDLWQNAEVAQTIYEHQSVVTHIAEAYLPEGVPLAFSLGQNYPNPFNTSTKIPFSLPPGDLSGASLRVYNVLGQVVRHLQIQPVEDGWGFVTWDGCDDAGRAVASGLYLYCLERGNLYCTKKMLLFR